MRPVRSAFARPLQDGIGDTALPALPRSGPPGFGPPGRALL